MDLEQQEAELAAIKKQACENPETFLRSCFEDESADMIVAACKTAGLPLRTLVEFRCKCDTAIKATMEYEIDTWIKAYNGFDPNKHIAMRFVFGLMAAESFEMHCDGYKYLSSVLVDVMEDYAD